MDSERPNLYIIAGPNGAGKTTFVGKFLPEYAHCLNFVNADMIAAGLSPFSPELASIRAGRLMLEQIHNFSRQKVDFAFETTLSGLSYIKKLNAIKADGYRIVLLFLWLRSPEIGIMRVNQRVKRGGHDVPEPTIRRRYYRGLFNLFKHYLALADTWIIFDNSTDSPDIIAFYENERLSIRNTGLFEQVKRYAEGA